MGTCAAIIFTACTAESGWSEQEKEDAKHFFLSLDASRAATQLINEPSPPGRAIVGGAEEMLAFHKTALLEAQLTPDAVLDKAHPELRTHFRSEYQRGVELLIQGMEYGMRGEPTDVTLQMSYEGTILVNKWTDWLNAHRNTIRIPK